MTDRSFYVSANTLLAGVAWCVVGVLVGLACLVSATQFGVLACASSALAATFSIRGYCLHLGREMRNAFELGKDAARAEVVRPMARR